MNTTSKLPNETTSVSLSCEAGGALSYYWERQDDNISAGASGVNTNTLTISNLTPEDAGNYRCVASNASGKSYSNFAKLTVIGKYICIHIMVPLISLYLYMVITKV